MHAHRNTQRRAQKPPYYCCRHAWELDDSPFVTPGRKLSSQMKSLATSSFACGHLKTPAFDVTDSTCTVCFLISVLFSLCCFNSCATTEQHQFCLRWWTNINCTRVCVCLSVSLWVCGFVCERSNFKASRYKIQLTFVIAQTFKLFQAFSLPTRPTNYRYSQQP